MLLIQTDPNAVDAGLFLGYFLAFIVFFFMYGWHYYDKFKNMKVVYCFQEKEVDGQPVISTEIELLGVFKKVGYDQVRKLHTITFRHNLKNFTVYSKYSWDQYVASFKRKKWLRILYDMDAYVFKRKIPKGKDTETDFKAIWKAYFLFKGIFQFTLKGIASSFLIMGLIVSGCAEWDFLVFLIGGFIGIGIALGNSILYEKGIIKPKRKKEKTFFEWVMFPTEPLFKIIDVYKVKGEKLITVEKADKPESEWEKFKVKVQGFEEVQKILRSDLYRDVKYKKIAEVEEERNYNEIIKAQHSALYQMRYLYNEIVESQDINTHLQRDNRSLYNQLSYLKATEDRRRNEFVMDFLQEQQKNSDNFKDVFKKLSGDMQFGLKWDKIASRVLREVEERRGDNKLDKLELISQIMLRIVEKLTQLKNGDTMLDIGALMNKLNIKEEDFVGITANPKREKEKDEGN